MPPSIVKQGKNGDTFDKCCVFLPALCAIGHFSVGNDRTVTEDLTLSQSDAFQMNFISCIHF